jgi:tetratricopeptide (TPR) repeat protein
MPALEALIVGGVSWVLTQAAGGVIEGAGDRTLSATVRSIRDRFPALTGTPDSDTLARGLRKAQFGALRTVIEDFREVGRHAWLSELGSEPDPFYDPALRYCGRADQEGVGFSGQVLVNLVPTVDGLGHSASEVATSVEDTVLDELRAGINPVSLPKGFEEHFRKGGRSRQRFIELFGTHFLEQIKTDAGFRNVLMVKLLLRNAAQTLATAEFLRRLEQRFGGALDRVADQVAQANHQLIGVASAQTRQDEKLSTILELLSTEKGVPVAPLRAILERFGDQRVPDHDIVARLAKKADEYLDLREQWLKAGAATPDLEAVRRNALRLIDIGDLDGARGLFAEARKVVRSAREERAREEAALLADEGRVDELDVRYRAAAQKYREAEELVVSFDAEARFNYLRRQASALRFHGAEFGDNQALEEAIALWERAVSFRSRADAPLVWGLIQNNLGNALSILGERESGTGRLAQAVSAYHAALEERTRERVPLDWAATQNNLGNALRALGVRESGTELLQQSVRAYRAALEERTHDQVPAEWAETQNNLGTALQAIGRREGRLDVLTEAADRYRNALREISRETRPLMWATIQNNLGTVLALLGEEESGTERLEEAITAFHAALKARTRDRVPLEWAMTQSNLGKVLRTLGARETGTKRIEWAVDACRAALEERTSDRVPLDWAKTQQFLGNALHDLGEREGGTNQLKEAVSVYRAALEVVTPDVSLSWATEIQKNLEHTLRLITKRDSGTN